MNKLFTIMIMWVLVYNGLCPQGLALGYTITVGVGVLLIEIAKALKEKFSI